MNKKHINKIDFFVGVFVTAILNSATSIPALFEETDESKRVEFYTNLGRFNVYVKYSTVKIVKRGNGRRTKDRTYWNITFTEKEHEKLCGFSKSGFTNYIPVVCTNPTYTSTCIAILDYEKVMKHLRNTTTKGSRRITIIRYGREQKFSYGGVGFDESEYETCLFDYTKYFDK